MFRRIYDVHEVVTLLRNLRKLLSARDPRGPRVRHAYSTSAKTGTELDRLAKRYPGLTGPLDGGDF